MAGTRRRSPAPARRSQTARRAESRAALLAAAARGLSAHGYANLNLGAVATEAGYTRGALYHHFSGKDELALAAVAWVIAGWREQVAPLAVGKGDAARALIALARAHVSYCREGHARILLVLRIELPADDDPVGAAVGEFADELLKMVRRLIKRGRSAGTIPGGPKARVLAAAYLAAIDGLAIGRAGQAGEDADLAERAVRGLLGLETLPRR